VKGFLRTKFVHGKPRHYWCISERRPGKKHPSQKVTAYLGNHRSPGERIVQLRRDVRRWMRQAHNQDRTVNQIREYVGRPNVEAREIANRRLRIGLSLVAKYSRRIKRAETAIKKLSAFL
jgi:hypothetical protein